MKSWEGNVYQAGSRTGSFKNQPSTEEVAELRANIEPWLASVLQSEHLSLLVGSGLPIAIASIEQTHALGMDVVDFGCEYEDRVLEQARKYAQRSGRGNDPNIEDQLRAALVLVEALEMIGDPAAERWRQALRRKLDEFVGNILMLECRLRNCLKKDQSPGMRLLLGFLMSFASRAATRERLNLFTTNYDRLIEYAADRLGLRTVDRFVGNLEPEFRASRQSIDIHYNPPGIRGEPRYLEGVVRLTKLHGSIDWTYQAGRLVRTPLSFGFADRDRTADDPLESTIIFPNSAKDSETLYFPYAELFRDFAASICQPNSSLVTYGYGFGDDHINRIMRDMLTIPSTHLVVISFGDPGGRIERFVRSTGRTAQISLLLGRHFGDLPNLVDYYLPKPAIDVLSTRMRKLQENRGDLDFGTPKDDRSAAG